MKSDYEERVESLKGVQRSAFKHNKFELYYIIAALLDLQTIKQLLIENLEKERNDAGI